jgi:diadenosine tetraphosphate (Ap4A) HIT family hydrolase
MIPEKQKTWMPREQWDSLVRGENCPLCVECHSTEWSNNFGYTVTDLRLSRLRLAMNQYVAGYCVLICHRHVQEPYHLTDNGSLFFEDMMAAAQAIEWVFNPLKLNFQLLGNLVPHLHAHLVPRYYGDPAPGRPIDPEGHIMRLTAQEYQERVGRLQEALEILRPAASE